MRVARFFNLPPFEHRWWSRAAAALLLEAACTNGFAADINVVGLFPGKALVSIDGGQPRTLSAGQQTADGIKLISVTSDTATLEIDGQRRTLRIGQAYRSAGGGTGTQTVVLSPDTRGQYLGVGTINDKAVRFLVDTGATSVALGTTAARQLGIAYRHGRAVTISTANGKVGAFAITLDSVRLGGLTLDKVEAIVTDGMNHWDGVLLGMSFIGRLSMQRDGQTLRLSLPGAPAVATAATMADKRDRITLAEMRNGMFAASAKINGIALPFLIDTGATTVSMDAALAEQAGIRFRSGTPGVSSTANGLVRSWSVRLDSIAVGPITLYGIEATVREGPGTGGIGLLGMSFLNRVEMKRENETLTLIKRF